MIKRIHIYDLDGTIVSSLHRYKTIPGENRIDLEHWRENSIPEKIAKDSLLPHAAQYKTDLQNPETYVIIATARACYENDATYHFIRNRLGFPNKFIHRQGDKDTRKGARLKIAGIKPLLNLRQFKNAVIKVWEDNESYLQEMCQTLNATGALIYSAQRF